MRSYGRNRIKFNKSIKCFYQYWAIFWIVAIWLIFARPYFLQGAVPFPSRYLVDFFPPWNNAYGLPVKNNAMPDVITQIYPWKKLVIASWKQGQIPFWNPYQFAGNPLLANYQAAVFSPLNILFFFLPFIDAWSLLILFQPLLAAFFMYLFMRELKISKFGALLSSISFMFAGFLTVWMAYGTVAYAILFLPLLLFGIERYVNKRDKLSALFIIVSIPLSLFSGHFQTSIYFLLTGALYILFKFTQKRNFKLFVICCLLFVAGLLISLPQLLPSMQFYQQSVRSELFQKEEAIPWNYLITAIAPDFFGNPVTRNDWFGHYAEWAGFAGVIPLMLALFLFVKRQDQPLVYFFGAIAVFSLLFAFQTPFVDLLVGLKIPVLSTSPVSRIIVLFSFAVCLLSGFGFDFLADCRQQQRHAQKLSLYVLVWLIVVGMIWLLLFAGNLLFVHGANMQQLRIAKRNFLLPSLLVAGGGLLSVLFVHHSGRSRLLGKKDIWRRFFVFGLLLLISVDMLRFATKWMPFEERKYVYPKNKALDYLQNNADNYRIFGNFNNAAAGPFALYGIEGYNPLYIRRYGELMTAATDGVIKQPSRSAVKLDKNGAYTKKILDLFSVKYILHSKGDKHNIWAFPFWKFPQSFSKPVYRDQQYVIYENTKSLPRAFLVYDYKIANSDQEIVDLMFDGDADLSKTVILEEKPNVDSKIIEQYKPKVRLPRVQEEHDFRASNGALVSNVAITKYTPNEIEIEVQTNQPALLFLSDNYYPGWNAYVNGKKSKIYRADYTFRAVEIPAGQATVKFSYENWYF